MNDFASGLYTGEVIHQRFAPVRHRLRYRMFQMMFDVDELPRLNRSLLFFSHNSFNLLSFHDADHGDRETRSLRVYIEKILSRAGFDVNEVRISLLCMPRILGYVFNPISIYYCRDARGELIAMIYEVNNTFGQTHTYLIPAMTVPDGVVRQSCAKSFHVSPFMDMDMTYEFTLTDPGQSVVTVVNGRDRQGSPLIHAIFSGRRRAISDVILLVVLLAYPLLTLGVVAAIHWEALKLFLKGVRLHDRPSPPMTPVTVVSPLD